MKPVAIVHHNGDVTYVPTNEADGIAVDHGCLLITKSRAAGCAPKVVTAIAPGRWRCATFEDPQEGDQ